jgi:hypothetical protein
MQTKIDRETRRTEGKMWMKMSSSLAMTTPIGTRVPFWE